jgi:hypothetical protein
VPSLTYSHLAPSEIWNFRASMTSVTNACPPTPTEAAVGRFAHVVTVIAAPVALVALWTGGAYSTGCASGARIALVTLRSRWTDWTGRTDVALRSRWTNRTSGTYITSVTLYSFTSTRPRVAGIALRSGVTLKPLLTRRTGGAGGSRLTGRALRTGRAGIALLTGRTRGAFEHRSVEGLGVGRRVTVGVRPHVRTGLQPEQGLAVLVGHLRVRRAPNPRRQFVRGRQLTGRPVIVTQEDADRHAFTGVAGRVGDRDDEW